MPRDRVVQLAPPIPLVGDQSAAPDFPLDALGPLAGVAKALCHHVQCPASLAAQAILTAATLVAQPRVDVQHDGRRCPTSEFFVTVASSGERKSSADNLAMQGIRDAEKKRWAEYNRRLADWHSAPKTKGVEAPDQPRPPHLLMDEPSIEGLIKALDDSPAIGLCNAEGGQFLAGHAMGRERVGATVTGLSRLWDGTAMRRIRAAADENRMLFNRRLCMHLAIQPVVAARYWSGALLEGQGIQARCLSVSPDTMAGTRLYRPSDPASDPTLTAWWSFTQAEMLRPYNIDPDTGGLLLRDLVLTPPAREIWIKAHDHIERESGPRGEYAEIRPFALKAAEHLLRLAGILTYAEDPERTDIRASALSNAVTLVDQYLDEALRMIEISQADREMQEAQELLAWLRNRQPMDFTQSDIIRNGPRKFRSASKARKYLTVLLAHGHVFSTAGKLRLNHG